MSYQFLDAYASVLTADSSVFGALHRPIVGASMIGVIQASIASNVNVALTRNDAVASFLGVNLTTRPFAGDSAGRLITKPFAATEALVQGVSSTVNTAKSSLIGLSGAGLRTYLTDILVANTGSVVTFVSFSDSDGSVIGRTIAPATSGSNIHLATPMRTGALNSQVEFTAATAVSILSVSAYGYTAP